MKAAEWMRTVPWCITTEALEAMESIAQRAPLADAAERLHGPQSLALRNGTQRDDTPRVTMRDGVAAIRIDGPIYRYADMFTAVSGGVTTEALARDIQTALDDPRTEAILLAIDSPGGEATGIGELADAIYAGRQVKPIGAYIEGYGASAAYWIASAAETVIADASALIGSIGTVLATPNPQARPQPARSIEIVSTQSPKKRVDPTTQAGQAYLQGLVDDMTEVFIGSVMRNRGMTREQVLAVEGGVIVGQHAVAAGLADRLGSEEQAIIAMKDAAYRRRERAAQPRRATVQEVSQMDLRQMFTAMFGGAKDAGLIASDGTPEPVAESIIRAVPAPDAEPTNEALRVAQARLAQAQGNAAEAANTFNNALLTTADTVTAGELARLQQAVQEREAQIAALQQAERERERTAFVSQMIDELRIVPAQRETLDRLYSRAQADGFVDDLTALVRQQPAATILTTEVVSDPLVTLPQVRGESGDAVSADRRRELLSATPEGRAILAAERGA